MVRLKRILQAISPQRVGPLFAHCSFCHVTTNPEPKRLNLAFREWSVSGNCSHPVYVGDFLTSNRIWLVSPLVKPAFSVSADHTFIVCGKKVKTLRVGHSLGCVMNKYKCTVLIKFCYLIFQVRTGTAICKFNVPDFRCHLLPVIFSCTKQQVMLLDIANWCFLMF